MERVGSERTFTGKAESLTISAIYFVRNVQRTMSQQQLVPPLPRSREELVLLHPQGDISRSRDLLHG